MMRLKTLMAAAMMCLLLHTLPSAGGDKGKVHPIYNVDFLMNFDNREYDVSGFQPSETIFGFNMAPTVGLEVSASGFTHRINASIDIRKEFGDVTADNTELFHELKFFYQLSKDRIWGQGKLEMTAGIFPKSLMKEEWSTAFFSDKSRWLDNNMEGMLLSLSGPSYRIEAGCDWMGKIGVDDDTREQFMVLSAGHKDLSFMRFGYNFYAVHFANSATVKGVVDNMLAEPYARIDLSHFTGSFFQDFFFKLGWIGSFQRDRRLKTGFENSSLTEFTLAMQKWNIRLQDSLYWGDDILPYYTKTDAAGIVYGERLYFSDPFFRINKTSEGNSHIYNRAEASWMPRLCDGVHLGVSVVIHTNGKMLGNQEVVRLRVNLDEIFQ